MREILLRGKRTDTGEWVEGLLYKEYNRFYNKSLFNIQRINKFGIPIAVYEIAPETFGQFTGIYDKNGKKKIFEGDIVAYRGDEYGVIEYDVESARFCVTFDTWSTDFDHLYGKELEVIGNIHDNPEFMEV